MVSSSSPQLVTLYRDRMRRNAAQPKVDAAMELCLAAWTTLHGERSAWGTELGPIPYTRFRQWADDQELDNETTEMVWTVIRKQDAHRSQVAAAKAALESKGR